MRSIQIVQELDIISLVLVFVLILVVNVFNVVVAVLVLGLFNNMFSFLGVVVLVVLVVLVVVAVDAVVVVVVVVGGTTQIKTELYNIFQPNRKEKCHSFSRMLCFNLLGSCHHICLWSMEIATNYELSRNMPICHHSLALGSSRIQILKKSNKCKTTCSHKQPQAATSSHKQPQAATSNHKQPLAATCIHWQVAASGCFFENQLARLVRPQWDSSSNASMPCVKPVRLKRPLGKT